MTGQTRIAWCGAWATVLTSLCLIPLVRPARWLLQAALFVFLLAGVGLLARRLGLPRPVTVLVQLLVAVLLLALAFVSGTAWLYAVSTPHLLHELAGLYAQGGSDTTRFTIPAPSTAGLRLLLVTAVLVIGLLVDVLAATYQRVALAGLPLLGLYAVATALHPRGPLWFWLLVAGFGYLTLLLAQSQDRLARWGEVLPGIATGMADAPGSALKSAGYRIGMLSVVLGLLGPIVLPGVGAGLLDTAGGGAGNGNGVITSIDPVASLTQALRQPADLPVLSYTTDLADRGNQYLRIVDLDVFNGTAWTAGTQPVTDLHRTLPPVEGLSSVPQTTVRDTISTRPTYQQQWLPMPYPAVQVDVDGNWKYVPQGRTVIGGRGQNTGGLTYDVESVALSPTADQLRHTLAPPSDITKNDLALPADLPAVVKDDAESVTQNEQTPYDKAVALQDWFTHGGGFSYNTQVPAGTGTNAMAQFLTRRTGFCVHFAATMAAMARTLGIPARVAIGFAPGTQQDDGSWLVTTKDAHAWPELYFSGLGWLRFEPTPSVGVTPSYASTQATSGAAPSSQSGGALGPAPHASPRSDALCTEQLRRTDGCDSTATALVHTGQSHFGWRDQAALALTVLAGLLLLFPMLWRIRVRQSRLRRRSAGGRRNVWASRLHTPGQSAADLAADRQQVLGAWYEMIDPAWDLGLPPDPAMSPRQATARITRLAGLDAPADAAAQRLALAAEQELYSLHRLTCLSARQDVTTVRAALLAAATTRTRLRALLLPRSSARLGSGLRTLLSARRTSLHGGATQPGIAVKSEGRG